MTSRKVDTIASSEAISRIFKRGRRYNGDLLALYSLSHTLQEAATAPQGRVAFIAGKKLGGAVWRNRAKRILRAALAQAGGTQAGYDLLLVANSRTTESSSPEIAEELTMLFKAAHI